MNKLGINIKTVREEKGLSRRELAEKANITASALANYENGYRTPNETILNDIGQALDVDINYLLGKTKFKDFESDQLKEFDIVLDAIFKSSNKETVRIASNIIESLSLILFTPIYKNSIGTLEILYKYIEEVRALYSLVENKNYFIESNNSKIAKYGLYDFMTEVNERFKDITDEYYCYTNNLDPQQEEFLNLKSRKNNKSLASSLNIDDFSNDELKDLHNYIKFIRFNRNNKS